MSADNRDEDHIHRVPIDAEDQAPADRVIVGSALAAIEEDCSNSWPQCPRLQPVCDCKLRAMRAVNALKLAGRL